MLTVLVILAVLGILFGAAVLATYEGDVLKDPHPDDRDTGLPPMQLQPEDVAELRFDLALRGYRMSEVDEALVRLADELALRDSRIAQLEQALVDVVEPAVTAAEQDIAPAPEPPVEPPQQWQEPPPAAAEAFEPLEPPAVAPAVISGPLTATTWFTEPAPTPEPEPVLESQPEIESQPEPEPVDVPAEEPEPVASAPVDTWPEAREPTPPPDSLTLPAGDDAFSFPQLEPPDAADEAETPEQPSDWWTDHTERP